MKIGLVSDTHYGFYQNTHLIHKKFWSNVSRSKLDLLIHAGDWATINQSQIEKTLKMIRSFMPNLTICGVLGNHDFWDSANVPQGSKPMSQRILNAEAILAEYQVHRLTHKPFYYKDAAILGFDGWYNETYPQTNDLRWMDDFTEGIPTHEYMRKRANTQFMDVLSTLDFLQSDNTRNQLKRIVVSHFSATDENSHGGDPSTLDYLAGRVDAVCYGHIHSHFDRVVKGARVLRCGSDYDFPQVLVFDL
jgi:predicted phosphodiesterase